MRYSVTARDQLRELLALGVSRFGVGVVAEKRDRVFDIVDNFLAKFPATKRPHPSLGLVVYPASDTPFLVLYDYDQHELRIHFIFSAGANFDTLDPTSAQW